jgi:hypothetical protein
MNPPANLVKRIERLLPVENQELIKSLRAGEPLAFIKFGCVAIEQKVALDEAAGCFRYAVACGLRDANINLGWVLSLLPGREQEAEKAFLAAALAGVRGAHNHLGRLYTNHPSLKGDAEGAYRTALSLADVDALANLGILLQESPGRETESLSCLMLASAAGHPTAFASLGDAQAKFAARGLESNEFTALSIRAARSLRKTLPPLPERPRAPLLQALRQLSVEMTNETMLKVSEYLLTEGIVYQARLAELKVVDPPANRVFDNVASLLNFLNEEHRLEKYVYRGQLGRREAYRTADRAENEFVYENLFPSDFRFITKHRTSDKTLFEDEMATVHKHAGERCFEFLKHVTRFCSGNLPEGLALRAWLNEAFPDQLGIVKLLPDALGKGAPHLSVFDSFSAAGLWKLLWALAQHYELATALLDVTFSPDIAAWFASEDWAGTRAAPTSGRGVIYRFDLQALQGLLVFYGLLEQLQSKRLGRSVPARMPPFFQDLRAIPLNCASRPKGQQGASIYGFDSVWLLESVAYSGVMEVFEFEHTNSIEISISRDLICPEADPFLAITRSFVQTAF